jgi:hypothetical protein
MPVHAAMQELPVHVMPLAQEFVAEQQAVVVEALLTIPCAQDPMPVHAALQVPGPAHSMAPLQEPMPEQLTEQLLALHAIVPWQEVLP